MYEQVSHSLLNDILKKLKPEIKKAQIQHFYTRLGANFYAIYSLFHHLYGKRDDFEEQAKNLVETLARQYIARPSTLKKLDQQRENEHNWFLDQKWTGMALYTDGFAGDLKGIRKKIPYFKELGINMIHIMPILKCPAGASDGGYAVSNFREIDESAGTMDELRALSASLRKQGILLTMDVVVNHTSNEHEWAQKAESGEVTYQDYYYIFDGRDIPDMFEETMPEIFPETAPGNFTWNEQMNKWVMTVFNHYQWDLNYSNPAVFIEMIDIILYWANQGADVIRLDAVAFLWKKIGTVCQNEREAHLLLQLMKDCCQVTAPGVLFIAEAIVAPLEIIKYFGEDAVIAKECEIAYNATFMALLWDAVATKNTKLLSQGIRSLPDKLSRATWLNYIRCHDDIGLGFDDSDIFEAGYDPGGHRKFLIDYFTGNFEGSAARGKPFGFNPKTGDSRISGSLASLVGLESSLEKGDKYEIDANINLIVLLHSLILSFGGIPLLYYGDELGTTNCYQNMEKPGYQGDTRWIHRPKINWERAEQRKVRGTPENRIFEALKRMISVRKLIPEFADFNNRELIQNDNEHLFAFIRIHPEDSSRFILVLNNFDAHPQHFDLRQLDRRSFYQFENLVDLYTGDPPPLFKSEVVLKPYQFMWLEGF